MTSVPDLPENASKADHKELTRIQGEAIRELQARVFGIPEPEAKECPRPPVPWSNGPKLTAGKWHRFGQSESLVVDRAGFTHLVADLDESQEKEFREDVPPSD